MNIKQLKKMIANMPDDAPVLLSVSNHSYKPAGLWDNCALRVSPSGNYEEFVEYWQLDEPGTEKIQALCLY